MVKSLTFISPLKNMAFQPLQVLILMLWITTFTEARHIRKARRWTYTDELGEVEVVPASLTQARSVEEGLSRDQRCACHCRRKWSRTYTCCECLDSTCFPATARVTMATGEEVTISRLQPGDLILTANLEGSVYPTTVLGYLDRRHDVISQYHVIHTSSGARLTLSGSHMLYVATDNNTHSTDTRYARDVVVGDYVIAVVDDVTQYTMVTDITLEGRKGAFVPLTTDGTLLVDGVLTSCYASFPHHVAHVAMAPLRWLPGLTSLTPDDGIHPYVSVMKTLGRLLLPTHWLGSARDPVGTDLTHIIPTGVDSMETGRVDTSEAPGMAHTRTCVSRAEESHLEL